MSQAVESQSNIHTKSSVNFKGGMYTLTSIQLLNSDYQQIAQDIQDKIQQAPNFFRFAPVILDVQHLSENDGYVDFLQIKHILKGMKLIAVAVQGANEIMKNRANQAGLATLTDSGARQNINPVETKPSSASIEKTQKVAAKSLEPKIGPSNNLGNTKLITQPVRSGQQIYAQGGDLIVMAAVSPGAELLADGHIHVHGPLRGRALAGVTGNKDAIIYSKSLEAELVSIAGQYIISERIKDQKMWKQSGYIRLDDQEKIQIQTI